MEDKLEIE